MFLASRDDSREDFRDESRDERFAVMHHLEILLSKTRLEEADKCKLAVIHDIRITS